MNLRKAIQSILVLGILLGSQTSFAMKRTNPFSTQPQVGLPSIDQLMMWAEALRAAVQALFSAQAASMEPVSTSQAETTGVTYTSQTGDDFFFPYNHLEQLSVLAPALADTASPISSHTFYLLTEILSGNYDLGHYVLSLTEDELEKIKEDAQFLEATALQNFISGFLPCRLGQPFIPTELSALILSKCGPVARNKMREVSSSFKNLVDKVREPKPEGFGLTDTLPELAQILVGVNPLEPVILGNFLYVADYEDDLTVINLSTSEAIETIDIGCREIFVFEGFLYLLPDFEGAISVIDPEKNKVVKTISHEDDVFDPEHCSYNLFGIDHLLYVMCDDGFISVIDPKKQGIVKTIYVIDVFSDSEIHSPVVFGDSIYVLCTNGFIYVIDPQLGKVTGTVQIDKNLFRKIVVIGELFYLASEDGVIFVFDPATNKVIKTFKTGVKNPKSFLAFGNLIYLQSGKEICSIDPATGEVLNSIEPQSNSWGEYPLERAVVLGQTLYIPTDSGSLVLVELATGKFIRELKVGATQIYSYIIGQFLFLRSGIDSEEIISVMDPATNKIIKVITIGRFCESGQSFRFLAAFGTSLYVVFDSTSEKGKIVRIDIGGYL